MKTYLQEINFLKKKIENLQSVIKQLKSNQGKNLLKQKFSTKGLIISKKNPTDNLFLPKKSRNEFYSLLLKYSFRLFLRDIIQYQDHLEVKRLTRYCSIKAAKRYLAFLEKFGLVKKPGKKYKVQVKSIYNFGTTLEWFISRIFKKQFDIESYYKVSFTKAHKGGDFDIIGILDQNLVFVEVKSSPPKHIEEKEIKLFLERINFLSPDIVFFFDDTHLRMKDKIVVMFENMLKKVYPKKKISILRLEKEIFHINHKIYILNSKGSIVRNFRICFEDFFNNKQMRLLPLTH